MSICPRVYQSRLVVELQGELDVSCGLRGINQPKASRVWRKTGIWVAQLDVVECVEEIGTELQIRTFSKVNVL